MALAGICRTTQVLRFFKFSRCPVNFLTETQQKHIQYPFLVNNVQCKYYCMDKKPATPGKPGDPKTGEQAKKKKGLTSPQITLIQSEDEVHAMTLEQAEKLARRRNLKLVKIIDFDTKTEKPVYKLMTSLEFFEEGSKMKEKKRRQRDSTVREPKLFTISSKIGDNDLGTKTRMMFKLLKKKHEVRIFISYDGNPERADELGKLIEEELAEVTYAVERTTKSNTLKLVIKPKLETEATASETDATTSSKIEKLDVIKNKAAAMNVKK